MILEEIAKKTTERIEAEKRKLPLEELRAQARDLDARTGFPFEQALAKPGIRFICEATSRELLNRKIEEVKKLFIERFDAKL